PASSVRHSCKPQAAGASQLTAPGGSVLAPPRPPTPPEPVFPPLARPPLPGPAPPSPDSSTDEPVLQATPSADAASTKPSESAAGPSPRTVDFMRAHASRAKRSGNAGWAWASFLAAILHCWRHSRRAGGPDEPDRATVLVPPTYPIW